jgi:DNA-binding XRE family transcriptional regulator
MKHEENTAAEVERTKGASTVTSANDGTAPTTASFGGESAELHLIRTDVRVEEKAETLKAAVAADVAAEGSEKAPEAGKRQANNLRKLRIERMMSKAELARRANLSVLTIDRIEKGFGCRMDSKRKILEALGLSLGDRVRVFGEEE